MAIGNFLGGLAQGYLGYRQGEQDALNRQRSEEDREYLRRQRAELDRQQEYAAGQRARALREQERSDRLRDTLGRIKTTKTVTAPTGASDLDGNPITESRDVQRPQGEIYRDAANAYRDAGDMGKYLELSKQADLLGFEQASRDFGRLQSGSGSMSLGDVANGIAQIFNSDPTNGEVTEIVPIQGGVRMTVRNRDTGATSTREFTGPAAKTKLLSSFQPVYDPAGYKARIEEESKVAFELLKKAGVTSVPGGYVSTNQKLESTFYPTTGVGLSSGGSSGGRGGVRDAGGKEPLTPFDSARAYLSTYAEKGEDKLTGAQRARAESLLPDIVSSNPGLHPSKAAAAAYTAAVDPTKMRIQLWSDGTFRGVIDTSDGGPIVVRSSVSPDAAQLPPEEMTRNVEAMIAQSGASEYQQALRAAAFDPSARQQLIDRTIAAGRQVVEEAIQQAPARADEIRANGEARVSQDLATLNRRLALISTYTKPPRSGAPQESDISRLKQIVRPGGLGQAASNRWAPLRAGIGATTNPNQ